MLSIIFPKSRSMISLKHLSATQQFIFPNQMLETAKEQNIAQRKLSTHWANNIAIFSSMEVLNFSGCFQRCVLVPLPLLTEQHRPRFVFPGRKERFEVGTCVFLSSFKVQSSDTIFPEITFNLFQSPRAEMKGFSLIRFIFICLRYLSRAEPKSVSCTQNFIPIFQSNVESLCGSLCSKICCEELSRIFLSTGFLYK